MSDTTDVEEQAAPQGKPRRRRVRRGWKIALIAFGLVLVLAVGAAGYYYAAVMAALDSVQRDPAMMPSGSRPAAVEAQPGTDAAPVNIVIMGSDSRGTDQGRSDVLMMAHISGDRKNVYLVSFPRDYWVEVPGHGEAKINAAYAWGGAALSIQTLESITDVPMDHTLVTDFVGFTSVIDKLGGVTVDNKVASTVDGYSFPVGEVTLTGESALVYVRDRKNLPGGDLDRTERQRAVVAAVIDKLTSAGVVANPVLFRDSITTLAPYFTVDAQFTTDAMIKLGLGLSGLKSSGIKSLMAPTTGTGTSADGQSIVIPDDAALADLSDALRNDDMSAYYAQYGS